MSEKLSKLREAGVAHPGHEFSEEEIATFESLSDAEVDALISAKKKLGDALISKKDPDDEINPDTMIL